MTKVRVADGKHFSLWRWPTVISLGVVVAFSTAAVGQNQSTSSNPAPRATPPSVSPESHTTFTPNGESSSPNATANASAQPTGMTGARAKSYYHFAIGYLDEQSAEQYGRPELATQAIEQYKLAITQDPDSVFLQNSLADTYFKLGRIREAIGATQRILKDHPDDLKAHKLLGRIYLRSLSDSDKSQQANPMLDLAIQQFQKIVQLEPDEIKNRLILGQLFTLKHDTANAKAQFEEARRIDPGSEDVVLSLARLYAEQNQMPEALSLLQSVPANERTFKIDLALGALYDHAGNAKLAIAAYQDALNLKPDSLDAQRSLAEDLAANGQTDAALKLFQGIAEQDPQDIHSFLRIAELERAQGHWKQAEAALDQARTIDPKSVEVRYNEALVEEAKGHLDKAAAILNELVDSSKPANQQKASEEGGDNRAIFFDHLATIYREQNKTEQAIAVYKEMIAMGGAAAERAYQGQVDTYREAKMLPEATAAAQQAVQALPKNIELQLTLAGQLVDTGKSSEGIDLAKAQLKGTEQDRVVWLTLAQIYTRLHKWKDASSAIDKAQKLGSSKHEMSLIHFLRGALEERQKHIDAAEHHFREALALEPNNALTLNYLGYMLADHGLKLNEALSLIKRAVKLEPENGAYLDSLGWVHYKLGQYALAEQALEKAIVMMPKDPTVRDHLGEVYASTGHLHKAVAQWESSLENYANSAPADAEPSDVNKVRKRLDRAKTKLAKEETHASVPAP